MKKWLPCLLSMLCASVALADTPTVQRAEVLVQRELLKPLKDAESQRKRFSRAARPPEARRVRLLDTSLQTDLHGEAFVRFAIDEHYGSKDAGRWQREVYTGCAYPEHDQVFVLLGHDYMRVSVLLNGREEPVPNVCRATATRSAPLAAAD